MIFQRKLESLRKSNLLRNRGNYAHLVDFASNDYLGLSRDVPSARRAFDTLELAVLENKLGFSATSSMLISGYTSIASEFERALATTYGFASAIVLGAGFMGNLAIIEALVLRGDVIFIDEYYHASGRMACTLASLHAEVVYFNHNDLEDLKSKIKKTKPKNNIFIAIEGLYSMDGTIADRGFYDLALEFDAYLIVDEAHSVGTIGTHLLGYFDLYNLPIHNKIIKLGTMGKALASYGSYILCSEIICEFLLNRAKSIIYSTAISPFDVALAREHFALMISNSKNYIEEYKIRYEILMHHLGDFVANLSPSPLMIIKIDDNNKLMRIKENMQKAGFHIGAIRYPTVPTPRLRLCVSLANSVEITKNCATQLKKELEA